MTRRSALLLPGLLLMLAGCPPPPQVPDLRRIHREDLAGTTDLALLEKQAGELEKQGDPPSLEDSLEVRDREIELAPTSYDFEWKASRAAFLLAEDAIGEAAKWRREKFAKKGVDYGQKAIALAPKKVEGQYYTALNLGLLATTKSAGALLVLPEMIRHAKAAVEIDDKFEHGGPRRLLGAILVKAPSWPASVGDVEEGGEQLAKAVAIDPGFPENHLLYCEALIANDKRDEARKECEAVLAAPAQPDWNRSMPRWRAEAERLLQRIRK